MARTTLNATDRAALKAFILADPVLSTKVSGPGTDLAFIANALNLDASPVVLGWRINVQPQEADSAPAYANFDTIAAGKRESWGFFLNFPRDFSVNKVRTWITDVWGAATALSNAEAILQAGTENCSVAENVIGGTSKVTGTVTALDRKWAGDVSINDVALILA